MSAPFIPELSLGAVETGGGWGVGEQFARLPPASVQAEARVQVYTVGPECDRDPQNDSDDELSSQESTTAVAEPVPTTHYASFSADDDDTFIDHGSTAPPASPLCETLLNNNNNNNNNNHTIRGGNVVKQTQCSTQPPQLKFARQVSRMVLQKEVRALVIAPDGTSLWAAFGDDPIVMLDFKGVELDINRTVGGVTHVHTMAVVRVPAAKTVTFKSPSSKVQRTDKAVPLKSPATARVDGEDTYALWCGISRGSIVIVDLCDFTSAGVIRDAHSQRITGVWYLSNGKVWTAGYDKALKVWDPQTRRRLKSRNIATVIKGLCYVSSCKQVWTMSDDALIRVFDASGNNIRLAKQSPDKPENAIRMRSEMRFIAYCEFADLVYVSVSRGLVVINPTTCDIVANVSATLTSILFVENMALVTGHGELLQCKNESIGLIDLSEPHAPSLIFRGAALEGVVTSVGLRLLTAVPFAVAVQEAGRSERFLTVFNYEDPKAFSRCGSLASIPQQRKVTVESSTVRRSMSGVHHNAVNSAHVATLSTSRQPVVFATDMCGVVPREEGGGAYNPPQQRVSAVVSSRVEGSIINNSGILVMNSNSTAKKGPATTTTTNTAATTNNTNKNTTTTTNNNNINRSNSNQNSNSNGMNKVEQSVAVQLSTPPELMASLTNIEKTTEDLKALFSHMRTSRPLLDDFSKLHVLVSRLAMSNQLGPALDTETMESIEREYQTLEGRVIVAGVERLRVGAAASLPSLSSPTPRPAPTFTANFTPIQDSGCGRRPVGSSGSGGGGMATFEMDQYSNGAKESSARRGGRMDESASVGTLELPSESLLRWMAQITRSGHGEREFHRQQLESLQRHNTRIVERNAALINGLARVEQALCTHAQRLLEEADAAMALSETSCDSSSPMYNQRHIHLLNQALQQVEELDVSSSPKKISDAIGSLITLMTRLFSAQQCTHNDEGVKRTFCGSSSGQTVGDHAGDVGRAFLNNGNLSHTGRSQSLRLSTTAVVAMRPQRVLSMVEEQIVSVEEFVKDVGKFWCCLEETRKVIYLPYEGGGMPDLLQDFMQFAPLWHLREAQVMLDVCKRESVMVMAEVVLSDIENRDGTVDSGNGGAAVGSTTGVTLEKIARGSPNISASVESTDVLGITRNDSARLASISLEMEAVASRIRESFVKAVQSLPMGVSREAVGGFFLIDSDKLHIDAAKFYGMLHWSRVTMHLLFECLESVEELVFHNDEQPRAFRKDNFKAIEQQVDDWRVFLEDVHGESTQLRLTILSSQQEAGVPRASTTRAAAAAAGGRGSHDHATKHHGGNCSSDGGDALAADQCTRWVVLFGLYVQCAERSDAVPVLFASHDSGDTLSAADFGLMALLNEIAKNVETLRAKSAALLHYCQKIQGRFVRIIEDAVVNEEAGQMIIPAWRGGPIAERRCKGFCHDMS